MPDNNKSPKNSSNAPVDGPLAINLDVCLADLVSISDEDLAAITGTTDAARQFLHFRLPRLVTHFS